MKGFMVFLTLALAASASARTPVKIGQRNIIDDALALRECLENAIVSIETSVGNLVGTVGDIENVIASNVAKFQACLAIGGENPSVIDQIQEANCILGLVDSIKADINEVVTQVETSVDDLLHATDVISACFATGEKKVAHSKGQKNIIDDAIALVECLENAVASIQTSVDNLLGTVGQIENVIASNVEKFRACLAIGGENPSVIDQIQEATCILGLVDSIEADVNAVVTQVETSVANLLGAADALIACL